MWDTVAAINNYHLGMVKLGILGMVGEIGFATLEQWNGWWNWLGEMVGEIGSIKNSLEVCSTSLSESTDILLIFIGGWHCENSRHNLLFLIVVSCPNIVWLSLFYWTCPRKSNVYIYIYYTAYIKIYIYIINIYILYYICIIYVS